MKRLDLLLRPLAPLIRPLYGGLGLVLMFHRLIPDGEAPRLPALETTPARLEAILAWFERRGYAFWSLADLCRFLRGETRPDRPFVLFTFDDGYRDNLTLAYPVFQRRGVPFTIHVTTSLPDRTAILWWYLLEDLLERGERIELETNGGVRRFETDSPAAAAQSRAALRSLLKYARPHEFARLADSLFRARGLDPFAPTEALALTWDEIRRLDADPLVTIGAHTINHRVLSRLDEAEARAEIAGAKHILETRLGHPVTHFAYPFGSRREAGQREARLAAECGFETALTTRYGNLFHAHAAAPLALPRYDMGHFPDLRYLDLIASGALAMRLNRLRRVMTL
ncbi:MAG: polysaccharide deacetylase family protein [Anaerolineales bacterium]